MSYCRNCRSPVGKKDNFCMKCGAKQTSDTGTQLKKDEAAFKKIERIDRTVDDIGDAMNKDNRIAEILRNIVLVIILLVPWVRVELPLNIQKLFNIKDKFSLLEISSLCDSIGTVFSWFDSTAGGILQFLSICIVIATIINILLYVIATVGAVLRQYWYEKVSEKAATITAALWLGTWIGKAILNNYLRELSNGAMEKTLYFTTEFICLWIISVIITLYPVFEGIREIFHVIKKDEDDLD